MDKELENEIKNSWLSWKKEKPWYCPKCKCIMNISYFPDCSGGTHPYKGTFPGTPYHDTIVAKKSLTFEEFCQAYKEVEKQKKF